MSGKIINKKEFIESLETLAHSWGSDTPPEVYWGMDDMRKFIELEYNVTIKNQPDETTYNIQDFIDEVETII